MDFLEQYSTYIIGGVIFLIIFLAACIIHNKLIKS